MGSRRSRSVLRFQCADIAVERALLLQCGVYVKAVAPITRPTESDCHLRTRLPHEEEEATICAELADFENQRMSVDQKIERLQRLVVPVAFDWFSRHDSVEKLREGLASRARFSPPVSVALLRFLGLPLPS